jgi:hypothetical protein
MPCLSVVGKKESLAMLSHLVPKTAEIVQYSCFFKRINVINRTHMKIHNLPGIELRT